MKITNRHFPSLESTNVYAKEHWHEFDREALTVISADEQSRGRGRGGRSWDSPKNLNCLLTLCSFCPKDFPYLQNFGQILSLACLEVLKSLDISASLKWPNDILIEGKKTGGILCDIQTQKGEIFIANGIGLNVNMTQEQLDLIPAKAASLYSVSGRQYDVAEIRKQLAETYAGYLQIFQKEGFSPFIDVYRQSVPYKADQKISFHSDEAVTEGTFHSLCDDGSLNLLLPNNEVKNFVNI